jgi:hypothetical protein
MTMIIGAGLSGLIAAVQFPTAQVIESNGPEQVAHKAVLRFRTDSLSRLTGIPFRQVLVRKSIWYDGGHCDPDMQIANLYSRKTNGMYLDRSIWNIESVERFIAPENIQQQLVDVVGPRITWNQRLGEADILDSHALRDPVISTVPMSILHKMMVGDAEDQEQFFNSPIVVDRYRIPNCDVFQTVYYPDPVSSIYRASITGDLLIIERNGHLPDGDELADVCFSFGIDVRDLEVIEESHTQRFGKITPINDSWRRNFIYSMTQRFGIYSLGRFAIWKNILLDDVVKDAAVIKRLIQQGNYGATLHHNKGQS